MAAAGQCRPLLNLPAHPGESQDLPGVPFGAGAVPGRPDEWL